MPKIFIDYYELFGLKKDASPEEIKNVYRKAMIEAHPDMHIRDDEETRRKAEYVTRLINEMRATLLNPEKRKAYDAERDAYYAKLKNPVQEEITEELKKEPEDFEYMFYDDEEESLTLAETIEIIRKAYEKAREEEKAYPIGERHKDIEKEYRETVGTIIENRFTRKIIGWGGHMFHELVYQLSKLRFRKNESFLEYIMRNRRNFATFLLAFSIFTSSLLDRGSDVVINRPSTETEETINEKTVTLTRKYTVKYGDSLYGLATEAGVSVDRLKAANGLDSDIIYTGANLKIPYVVKEDDLSYCVDFIDVEGRTPEEIAALYGTDVATLELLNVDAVRKEDGVEKIFTNQICVPNFISKDMLEMVKAANESQYQNQEQNKNTANHL